MARTFFGYCSAMIVTRVLLTAMLMAMMLTDAKAQPTASDSPVIPGLDSVEVSLVVCSPHEEIYSLYGHAALRWHDLRNGQDIVLNWGVFDMNRPFFIPRFIIGQTDYELGGGSFPDFCRYYRRWGSSVNELVLNLTDQEKQNVNMAVVENMRPENRTYRYNFLYDNCSTRPRDLIERCLRGTVSYEPRQAYEPTFRDLLHLKTIRHPWVTFGIDMLLGLKADSKTTREEQEFLPENLYYDFIHAHIVTPDGSRRPLVSKRRIVVEPGVQIVEQDFPLTPLECALGLLCLSIGIAVAEWRRHKTYKYWDAALMTVTGLAGCLLTVMLFSQHPTTSTNLQLLLINPIHLFYIRSILKRRPTRYWPVLTAMTCLFIAGAFLQSYAEGTLVLALCLLLRVCSNYINKGPKEEFRH